MKRIIVFSTIILCLACKHEPKDYAALSGKIENASAIDTIRIFKGKTYEKFILLNADGTFKDTLKVIEDDYAINIGEEYGRIYLKNDNTSSFNADYENFRESIIFEGDDSDTNNFSVKSSLITKNSFTEELFTNGSQEDLDKSH